MKRKAIMDRPAGLIFDLLHDIRKAMRTLRRAEKAIMSYARAEKRRLMRSNEWQEAKLIRDEKRYIP